MKKRIIWDSKLINLLKSLKSQGLTTKEIAKIMNLRVSQVFNACSKYRVLLSEIQRKEQMRLAWKIGFKNKIKNNTIVDWNHERLSLLQKYKSNNFSNKQIAKMMNIPFNSVCNANHKHKFLLSPEQRKKKLSEGGFEGGRIMSERAKFRGRFKIDIDLGYVLGVLFGDGSAVDRGRCGCLELRTTNKSFADAFSKALRKVTGEDPKYYIRVHDKYFAKEKRFYHNVKYYEVFYYNVYFPRNIIATFGKTTTKEWNFDVDLFWSLGKDFCKAVIRGLFDSEGSFYITKKENKPGLSFSTTNGKGANSLYLLLHKLGLDFRLNKYYRKQGFYEYAIRTNKKSTIKNFYHTIGFSVDYKQSRLREYVNSNIQESFT